VVVVSHSKGRAVGSRMYEYKRAPLVFAVEPDNGAHMGGTTITIRGENLCDKNDKLHVEVCDRPAKSAQCMGRYVTAVTSAFDSHSSGDACDVLVQSEVYGNTHSPHAFTYRAAPVITHITPREGRFEGGNEIHIFGADLTSGKGRISETVSVKVNGKAATVLDYTPSTVVAKVPHDVAATGFVDVEVNSKRHGHAHASGMYRIHSKPVIKHMSTSEGRANGGEHLTLFGTGMGRGDIEHVRIGEHKATVIWADPRGHRIKLLTPRFERHDEGESLLVSIKSRTHGHASLQGFKVRPRGVIHRISPAAGPAAGGTLVTIWGKHLGAKNEEDYHLVKINNSPATLVSAAPEKVVVRTQRSAPGVDGRVKVYSRHHGITTSPASLRFTASQTPQIISMRPAMSNTEGGELVVLLGERLCNAVCDDLEYVQVGNAFVKNFQTKSPKRIVFHAPSADAAGGTGSKMVTVRSKEFGDAESPAGFVFLEAGSAGVVWPTNAPMHGSNTVVIEGPNLGSAEEYRVMLAGVEAKVLSASAKILKYKWAMLLSTPL